MSMARPKPQYCITSQTPDIRPQLRSQGYSHFKGSDLLLSPGLEVFFQDFKNAYQDLSQDTYCPIGCRFRRLARFRYQPWDDDLGMLPYRPYRQAATFAPVSGDVQRQLAPLGARERMNPFLHALIRFDFRQLPLPRDMELLLWEVGVHLITVIATSEQPGVSTPGCLHKDGEPYGFIHLMGRTNVTGGASAIASNDKIVRFETTLADPLDTLAYVDELVYHHVDAIHVCPGYVQGERWVLLIDFAPLLPQETQF